MFNDDEFDDEIDNISKKEVESPHVFGKYDVYTKNYAPITIEADSPRKAARIMAKKMTDIGKVKYIDKIKNYDETGLTFHYTFVFKDFKNNKIEVMKARILSAKEWNENQI